MTTIHVPNMRHGYVAIADALRLNGKPTSPRGEPTTEILGVQIVLEDPTDALPTGVGRDLNRAIAAAEAAQLIGGFSSPSLLGRISPKFFRYMNDGVLWGAYGNRIGDQLRHVVRKIHADRDTRQAIITLWDPRRDNIEAKADYPCTVSLKFYVRNERLHMITDMRSNDFWLGLAFDVFQFTQVQLTLCNVLDCMPGRYLHQAGSLHVYARDAERAFALHPPAPMDSPDVITGFGLPGGTIDQAMDRAARVATDTTDHWLATKSEQWYIAQLSPYIEP